MRNVPGLETVYHDYSKKGVQFFYVYKALAHPQKDGLIQPMTLKERLMHVAAAKKRLDTKMPWLSDSMTNELKHAFGNRNNSEFVIGADGKIAVARSWSDPGALRKDLEGMVGKSDKATTIADLDRKPSAAPRRSAVGVVPKIERPESLVAVKVQPKKKRGKNEVPALRELRAESGQRSLS